MSYIYLYVLERNWAAVEKERWRKGNMFIIPQNLLNHWACWNAVSSNKKVTRGLRLVWHATIWMICKEGDGGVGVGKGY